MKSFSLILLVLCFTFSYLAAADYYIDAENGNDTFNGQSVATAWKTLKKASSQQYQPGDHLYLLANQIHQGSLELTYVKGSKDAPITVSSYFPTRDGNLQSAIINAKGFANGVLIENTSYIHIKDLIITANGGGMITQTNKQPKMRCGVLVVATQQGIYSTITLENLAIKDVFFEDKGFSRGKSEVRTANGTQQYGWGIRFMNQIEGASLSDCYIKNCQIENVAHTGIKFTGRGDKIRRIKIENNTVFRSGGPGIQASSVQDLYVGHNIVDRSGSADDSRKWGRGSGFWTWGSTNVLVEHNRFLNANGPADSAGAHIDFNCHDVVYQYNFSSHNAGGFCEILGNNYNCVYRYNISVNDGHRVKGKNGAFQEGKIFWLSGYAGKKKKRKGPFNSYFYNNTIYVKEGIQAKVAVDKVSEGVMMVNNIFYIEGEAKTVLGDQYVPDRAGKGKVDRAVFKNNLFLDKANWPGDALIQDVAPMFGNPGFKKLGGDKLDDYTPKNLELVKDKGIVLQPIPGDTIGLRIGLEVSLDILGNEIQGLPDLGAIEIKK